MYSYRYSRWDGSQESFPLKEEELMEQLSEQLMYQGDVSSALRTMIQKGVRGCFGESLRGLQDLLQRLRSSKQSLLERYDLNSVSKDLHEQLEQILQMERSGMQRRLEEVELKQGQGLNALSPETQQELLNRLKRQIARSREYVDNLPTSTAQALQQLAEYEFMDPEARKRLDNLLRTLQKKVLDSHFRDLSQRLQSLTPQDMAPLKEMLKELNQLLEEEIAGGSLSLQGFLKRHGHYFDSQRLSSLEELALQMQQQLSYMESLLKSMSPEEREKLREVLESAFQDQELNAELARLAANLDAIHPLEGLAREYPFQGEESIALPQALELMEHLQKMEELERQMRRSQQSGNLSDIDAQMVRQVQGEEAYRELEQLRRLTGVLEVAGYIRKTGNRFELTPKGMRRLGQKALKEIFTFIKKSRAGNHDYRSDGVGGEQVEATKRYEFGDAFSLDMQGTFMHALSRYPYIPLKMAPEDFEVHRTEQTSRASTVLMIDLSLSMAMRGNFIAAKKVALALDNLIRSQFPKDALFIVGFSTYAREVKSEKLPYLRWDELDPYTNIQHGLALSQRLLSRFSGGTRQIIMISDGEPTAHLEDGQLFLQYPPSSRTIRETLREVKRCTKQGITINTFMLDRNSYLVEFVDQMTRINRGRVFYTSPDRLGQYILVDYLSNRRRLLF